VALILFFLNQAIPHRHRDLCIIEKQLSFIVELIDASKRTALGKHEKSQHFETMLLILT
jgi:hypothetical protein